MRELNYQVSCTSMSVRVTHPDGRADFLDVPESVLIPAGREYPVTAPDPGSAPGVCSGVIRRAFVSRGRGGCCYTFHGLPARVVRAACAEWYIAEG